MLLAGKSNAHSGRRGRLNLLALAIGDKVR